MGWASGSELLDTVAKAVMRHIPKDKRAAVAKKLISAFEDADCDTISECEQPDIAREYDRQNPAECDFCWGTGHDENYEDCSECNGTGLAS